MLPFFVLIYYLCKLSSTSQFGNKACCCFCCRCLYLLCRILTLELMHFYNCYTAGSFSGWLSYGFNQTWRISFYSLHFFHFLHTLRVTLSTFGKCLPIQFSDMIRIWIFAFVKCPPLRFYFFPYFSDLFACRAFWTHYFLSFLSRIPLYQLSLSVLPLTYLGPIFATVSFCGCTLIYR